MEHGVETGIINQLSDGSFIEAHQLLDLVGEHDHAVSFGYQGTYIPKAMNELGVAGHPGRDSLFSPDSPRTAEEIARIDYENHEQQA